MPPEPEAVMKSVPLADVVVTLHFGFMVFVLLAQLLIFAGWVLRWGWIRNFPFRLVHLLSIVYVTVQAALDIECPLTTLERGLRGGYLHDLEDASAVGRFCNDWLYIRDVPTVYFALAYGTFMLLVILTWVFAPPRFPWRKAGRVGSGP